MIQHFTQHLPNIDVGLNVGSFEHYVGSPNIDISDVGSNLLLVKNVG